MTEKKSILVLSDLVGHEKVAMSAMLPVLNGFGLDVFNAPTAIVSNPLCHGKFQILDTTDYLQNTFQTWEELGFSFDAMAIGFIVNERQAEILTEYCKKHMERGVRIFFDPIMGDEGRLYKGVSPEKVRLLQKMMTCSDYILPNLTEALFLSGMDNGVSTVHLIDRLRDMGAKSLVITSVKRDDQYMVCGFDDVTKTYFEVPYEMIQGRFHGTGDLFAAVFSGSVLSGMSMEESVKEAVDRVKKMILQGDLTGQKG